ncbi:flavocytochrome c [Sesbania bispinosa]|nr:flavocytochrome c [Sesbania bispinosa]
MENSGETPVAPPPTKPPDNGAPLPSHTATEKEIPTPVDVVQQHNPSALNSSEKLGEENLHGDSITAVKHKKQPKSRAKIPSKSGTHDDRSKLAGKVTVVGNEFEALNLENSVMVGHSNFSVGKGDPNDIGPSIVNKKRLVRIKRPRVEPPFIQPKIFCAKPISFIDGKSHKSIPNGPGETSKPNNYNDGNRVNINASQERLPFNIQTSMNVEVVGLNHLRLLDEEDKLCRDAQDASMQVGQSMDNQLDIVAKVGCEEASHGASSVDLCEDNSMHMG